MKAKSLVDAHYRPSTVFSGCCRKCVHFIEDDKMAGRAVHFCTANTNWQYIPSNVAPMGVCDKFKKGGQP